MIAIGPPRRMRSPPSPESLPPLALAIAIARGGERRELRVRNRVARDPEGCVRPRLCGQRVEGLVIAADAAVPGRHQAPGEIWHPIAHSNARAGVQPALVEATKARGPPHRVRLGNCQCYGILWERGAGPFYHAGIGNGRDIVCGTTGIR